MEHEGCYGCGCLARRLADVQATVEALQAQLREGEAAYHKVGEYNDHLKQQVEALQRERDHAKKMEVMQKEVADNQTWYVRELRAALDAEREKVKELEANQIPHSMQHVIELQAMNNKLGSELESEQAQSLRLKQDMQERFKTIDKLESALRDERDRLKRALEEIAMGTAVWERDEMIDCATAALTPAGGVQQHPAFDEYGEHRQPTGLGDL
jgi:predicted  nucleic acid-binding Zn-ribbon protein